MPKTAANACAELALLTHLPSCFSTGGNAGRDDPLAQWLSTGTAPRLGRRVTAPSLLLLLVSTEVPICEPRPDPGSTTEPGTRLCSRNRLWKSSLAL